MWRSNAMSRYTNTNSTNVSIRHESSSSCLISVCIDTAPQQLTGNCVLSSGKRVVFLPQALATKKEVLSCKGIFTTHFCNPKVWIIDMRNFVITGSRPWALTKIENLKYFFNWKYIFFQIFLIQKKYFLINYLIRGAPISVWYCRTGYRFCRSESIFYTKYLKTLAWDKNSLTFNMSLYRAWSNWTKPLCIGT